MELHVPHVFILFPSIGFMTTIKQIKLDLQNSLMAASCRDSFASIIRCWDRLD